MSNEGCCTFVIHYFTKLYNYYCKSALADELVKLIQNTKWHWEYKNMCPHMEIQELSTRIVVKTNAKTYETISNNCTNDQL